MNTFERGKLNEANLSYEEVASLLEYDEISGELYWRVSRGRSRAGAVAGCVDSQGYGQVKINGVGFSAHRVIWLLVYGRWPTDQLDHEDGNTRNNDPSNLREVSNMKNARNKKLVVTNTSGFMGVSWDSRYRKWHARIKVDGRTIRLGAFRYKTSAIVARRKAERTYGFHPNHGRRMAA